MLKVGDRIPDFTVWLGTVEGKKEFRMRDALGEGDVLLVFFPLAFTSTCTEQLCDARDSLHFFAHVNARVFGFSTDTPHANSAYVREQKLGFPIISDPDHRIVDEIWETQTVSGVSRRAKRGLVVLGADGVVKHVWITDDADEWPGLDDVKRVLHAGHVH